MRTLILLGVHFWRKVLECSELHLLALEQKSCKQRVLRVTAAILVTWQHEAKAYVKVVYVEIFYTILGFQATRPTVKAVS